MDRDRFWSMIETARQASGADVRLQAELPPRARFHGETHPEPGGSDNRGKQRPRPPCRV